MVPVIYNFKLVRMSIDDYNMYGCLLMCIDVYNLKAMSIDDYNLYGSFLNV